MRRFLEWFLKGAVIGIANIIPGVSGGTMALVLGIYDRLIRAVGRFRVSSARELAAAMRSPDRRSALGSLLREHDVLFLGWIAVGAVAAILATSRLMEYLLESHHSPTYGFFFGLVAASVVFPCVLLRRRGPREIAAAIVAAVLVVVLSESVSPEEKLEAAREKAALEAAKDAGAGLGAPGSAVGTTGVEAGTEAGTEAGIGAEAERGDGGSWGRLPWFFLVGAVAISAMVLPGISGSFVLLLFGAYFDVLRAISSVQLPVLASFALGCLVGLALFVRLLDFLLRRYYSPTLAFLAGLMVGSLWNLWPWKNTAVVGQETLYLDNTWPSTLAGGRWLPIVTTAAGVAIVLAFFAFERRSARTTGNDEAAEPGDGTVSPA